MGPQGPQLAPNLYVSINNYFFMHYSWISSGLAFSQPSHASSELAYDFGFITLLDLLVSADFSLESYVAATRRYK